MNMHALLEKSLPRLHSLPTEIWYLISIETEFSSTRLFYLWIRGNFEFICGRDVVRVRGVGSKLHPHCHEGGRLRSHHRVRTPLLQNPLMSKEATIWKQIHIKKKSTQQWRRKRKNNQYTAAYHFVPKLWHSTAVPILNIEAGGGTEASEGYADIIDWLFE